MRSGCVVVVAGMIGFEWLSDRLPMGISGLVISHCYTHLSQEKQQAEH